jgi:seryl-tRNA(Sec) selenium transferase
MVFALLAVILVAAIVTTTVTIVNQTAILAGTQAMNTAVDLRFDLYSRQVRTNATVDKGQVCFPAERTCVTVDDSAPIVNGIATLTMKAVRGSQTRDYIRTTKAGSATRIIGFDAQNQPVWG